MAKYCPRCGVENKDDSLWCMLCNYKLAEKFEPQGKNAGKDKNLKRTDYCQSLYYSPKKLRNSIIKLIAFCLIVAIVLSIFFGYMGFNLFTSFSHPGIECNFNEDFWFEDNYLYTYDGWSFKITEIKYYSIDGIVISLKTYNKYDFSYSPINIFSPIDLYIGIDDVKNNLDSYSYEITKFDDREVYTYYQDNNIADRDYFNEHTGNNHIIPHNQEVLDQLKEINAHDKLIVNGTLVNLYGTKGDEEYRWNTDVEIGNYESEIILVDSIYLISEE